MMDENGKLYETEDDERYNWGRDHMAEDIVDALHPIIHGNDEKNHRSENKKF